MGVDEEQQVPPLRFASVGMTLLFEVEVSEGKLGSADGRTADPSTAHRSGRDDKEGGGDFSKEWLVGEEQQVPPLRFASVGMTLLFEVEVSDGKLGSADGRTADPSTSLRFGRDDKG